MVTSAYKTVSTFVTMMLLVQRVPYFFWNEVRELVKLFCVFSLCSSSLTFVLRSFLEVTVMDYAFRGFT